MSAVCAGFIAAGVLLASGERAAAQSATAAYSFNASSGTVLADVSGNNHTVNLMNGPIWSSGKFGNSLSFDGSNDLGIAAASNTALNLTNNRFTLSAWIYPRTNSGYRMIVNKPYGSGHSAPYFDWSMHRQASSGRLTAWLGCDRRQLTSNASTPLDAWTHVAVTYDGVALRHYINGVLDRTTSVSCAITNTNSRPIRIGANGAGKEVMNGLIDDVRIYARTLTAAEIQADMSAGLGGGGGAQAPTLSLSASPTSGPSGTSSTLTWSSANATSCTASGGWSGTRPTSGTYSTGALSSTRTYTLACTGNGGTVSRSATVTIASGSPSPTLTLSVSPTTVPSGASSNLTWSSANTSSCTASGAWSGSRPTSGSAATGPLTASSTFTLTCAGPGGSLARSTTVTVSGAQQLRGLDFQGNASTTGTVRFRFTDPLAIYPATYIWKVRPRHQLGYYTTFFWGNDGKFEWDPDCDPHCADSYYGAHPYPQGGYLGSTHKWEIAARQGDRVSAENVVYDVWYTQALRVWSDASGGKHHEFYWDLPNTSRVIRLDVASTYGNRMPPSPALTFGDAPWAPSREMMNGVLRGIQVYSSTLTLSEILDEIADPLSSSSGASSIWYLNLNPIPTDISDKSGRGNHPEWVGGERPLLWSGD